jgi:hypothetical protein
MSAGKLADDAVRVLSGKPPLALVIREGDPRGAVAVAVATGGVAPGPQPAVALAGLVEARLRARGVQEPLVTPGWDGYRARWLVASGTEASLAMDALREALLAPVAEAELPAVHKKLAALDARPLRDPALLDAARCTGEPFAPPKAGASALDSPPATLERVESWRKAAHGLGRVAIALAGDGALAEPAAAALGRGDAWPAAPTRAEGEPLPPADAPVEVYDATGEVPPGTARVTIAVHTPTATQATSVAPLLGAPRGPLVSRLAALDAPGKVRDVVAAAHARGGCVAVTIDAPATAPHGGSDAEGGAARLATIVALARHEIAVELGDVANGDGGRASARRAGDPRDAAERAAWWTLSTDREDPVRMTAAVGIDSGRGVPANTDAPLGARQSAIRAAVDRATIAWQSPVVDVRARVERGQGEAWILLASPCGSMPEAESDAGLGAAFAMAVAERAGESGVAAEPWVVPDGLGVLVHGPALAGEMPAAHARRLADAVARPLAADAVDPSAVARGRAELLRASEQDDMRALAVLASAVHPGHPSWISPFGTSEALGRSSDAAISARASAVRGGPLRAAVLANADAAQADAAGRALDRWVARRAGEARACPVVATPGQPRPGTYAVERATAQLAEAWLALPLPPGDEAARNAAAWIASALDGEGGLLARALGGLARAWSARVLGPTRSPALVLRVTTAHAALDAAVAQVRALLERLQKGALTDADRARAQSQREREALAASLDPRARVAALWRGDTGAAQAGSGPTLDALRTFSANALRDDALVIVATRPARGK